MSQLKADEKKFIKDAAEFFANPGTVSKGLTWIGKPIEAAHDKLPKKVKNVIAAATEKAIKKALVAALSTLPKETDLAETKKTRKQSETSSDISSMVHRGLTTVTGAVSGLFGLPALPIELPLTTVLILRGISDQARLYGHDLNDLETRLECLMVFSMGSRGEQDDGGPSAYFTTRTAFAKLVQSAAAYSVGMTAKEVLMAIEKGSAPILVRLIAQVAKTFQIRVAQKFMAESVPIAGALGGGFLNYAFTEFFVTTAKFHFGIRALEKKYSPELIQAHLNS